MKVSKLYVAYWIREDILQGNIKEIWYMVYAAVLESIYICQQPSMAYVTKDTRLHLAILNGILKPCPFSHLNYINDPSRRVINVI